uniref:energy-coupling factor transporter transmembrane component T family protein n=1 Tax=Olsenella uli TaxID=133926 RepID=UPI0028E95377|nr:energy-coupling factor transporter transmembrane component T [Olsenella uli]
MGGADIKCGLLGLDPRTHLLSFLVVGIVSMLIVDLLETALLQALAAAYLAANGRTRSAAKSCVGFAAICGLSFLPLPGLYGVLFVSMLHMIPPFTTGCAFFSLSPSAIMCALDRWHLPQKLLVGICMIFRFASILPFEMRSILRGIRMRGIFPSLLGIVRHPALAYECFYTPLVMRSLRLSSELAASAELRGIDIGAGRTSVYHVGFSLRDAVCAVVVAAAAEGIYALGAVS